MGPKARPRCQASEWGPTHRACSPHGTRSTGPTHRPSQRRRPQRADPRCRGSVLSAHPWLGARPPPPCRTLRNESFCSAIMERNSLFQPRGRSHDDQRRPWRPAEHQERPRPDPALPGGGAPGRAGRPQGTAGQDPVAGGAGRGGLEPGGAGGVSAGAGRVLANRLRLAKARRAAEPAAAVHHDDRRGRAALHPCAVARGGGDAAAADPRGGPGRSWSFRSWSGR